MQNELKIALIQSNLVWENPEQNRINFEEKINAINNPIDVIVLPEMFTTGFTMNASKVAESMDGETVNWMQLLAVKNNVSIIGSIVIQDNEEYYNRLICAHANGTLNYYDKRHTFTLAGEHKVYSAGNEKLLIDIKGWSICPLICYDLRFPVWARNTENYDVLIYVANWPKVRIKAWDSLLQARAIENMSYCIGVNRVGIDANNHEYSGHSSVFDTLGDRIDSIPPNKEVTQIVTLDKKHIETNRAKLNFLNDRDDFIFPEA